MIIMALKATKGTTLIKDITSSNVSRRPISTIGYAPFPAQENLERHGYVMTAAIVLL